MTCTVHTAFVSELQPKDQAFDRRTTFRINGGAPVHASILKSLVMHTNSSSSGQYLSTWTNSGPGRLLLHRLPSSKSMCTLQTKTEKPKPLMVIVVVIPSGNAS